MIENYDEFAPSKPVSAAFTAPIPSNVIGIPTSQTGSSDGRGKGTSSNASAALYGEREPSAGVDTFDASEMGRHSRGQMLSANTKRYPVMEMISQRALDELADTIMSLVAKERPGYITFPEFRDYVKIDPRMLNWFESLGSVF